MARNSSTTTDESKSAAPAAPSPEESVEESLSLDEARQQAAAINMQLEALGLRGHLIDADGKDTDVLVRACDRVSGILEGFRIGKGSVMPSDRKTEETVGAVSTYYDSEEDATLINPAWCRPGYVYRWIDISNVNVASKRDRQGYVVVTRGNRSDEEDNIPDHMFAEDGAIHLGFAARLARCPEEKVEARRRRRIDRHREREAAIYHNDPSLQFRTAVQSGQLSASGKPDPRSPSAVDWKKKVQHTSQASMKDLRGREMPDSGRVTHKDFAPSGV